jgi:hypothetical protein
LFDNTDLGNLVSGRGLAPRVFPPIWKALHPELPDIIGGAGGKLAAENFKEFREKRTAP